jgi:hypothetical protein
MAGKVKLVSFATDNLRNQQFALEASAKGCEDISLIASWNERRLSSTRFYLDNNDVLKEKRGGGLWLWKPYIILEELEKNDDSEFVLYYDVGRGAGNRLPKDLTTLIDWAAKGSGAVPGVYVPQYGPNSWWTKRDAFVLMHCDGQQYADTPQVQATFSLWRKNCECKEFVFLWLGYCRDRRIISDDNNICGFDNYDGFIQHRHDQSILTLLCIRENLKAIGSATEIMEKSKEISVVINQLNGLKAGVTVTKLMRRARIAARRAPVLGRLIEKIQPRGEVQRILNHRGLFP